MHALSKSELDVGFFTNRVEETLAFWREEIGLTFEPPVYFNAGLVQHRHHLGNTVIKINGADNGVAEDAAGGYGDLYLSADLVRDDVAKCGSKTDPNGHRIHFVQSSIKNINLEILVDDVASERAFLLNALGCVEEPTGSFSIGNCSLILKRSPGRSHAGHWVNAGCRYFTVHVMEVDTAFKKIIENGGAIGERPYAIADIAKISFVRSPSGNWIEVAQRRELAGAW